MKIVASKDLAVSDCLVIPFFEGKEKAVLACQKKEYASLPPVELLDFRGEEGEIFFFYRENEKRVILLGLGSEAKVNEESIRNSYAAVIKASQKKKCKAVSIMVPELPALSKEQVVQSVCEGLFLAAYVFEKWKTDEKKKTVPVEKIILVDLDERFHSIIQKVEFISSGVYLARDLVNQNADYKTAKKLSEIAKSLEKCSSNLKVTILDKTQIEKEKMGLLLAVNKASAEEPTFTLLCYTGNKASKDHTVLIGKGITYDTGGLSLKPSTGMETMKVDMSGAAIVLGTMSVIASLGLPINVTGVIPATDNAIGSRAFKPGDVAKGFSGKTVEIANTDAEGRLILADAIAYAIDRLHPTRIIDLATLTGAIVVALGEEISGLFSNNDELAKQLEMASKKTGELIWRIPLHDGYKKMLKSDIADLKNIGAAGKASSITAALFLQEFVKEGFSWAHLDIAGVAYLSEPKGYYSTRGTASGVRLLVEFLQTLPQEKTL
ncbi:MAG: leucyl aminopeptidase [Chlamydiota bacterium]